ncbi:MAG TPA: TIGR00730 family Rossman fold protein [Verrucomicrobiae bacterium]|nr:TIGR00730 family Rossman fold protein [Verrucomicrobiae bacterium]
MQIKALAVYCGSSPGLLPEYKEAAMTFGALLAREGIALVYGGGNVGLMGAAADGALQAGGKVIGVIPHALVAKELAHRGVTEFYPVDTMHQRKQKMADLADGFVALPGGIGTLEEIFEMLTWNQLHIHGKPCAFLNVAGYYEPLVRFLEHMVQQRFLKQAPFDALIVDSDGASLLARIRAYAPVKTDKWIDRKTS